MLTNDSIATLVCLSVCSRFNAAIPFLIVIVVTFVGMILSGYYTILYKNSQVQGEDEKNKTYRQDVVTMQQLTLLFPQYRDVSGEHF